MDEGIVRKIEESPEPPQTTALVPANNMFEIIARAVDQLGTEGAESAVAAIERLSDLKLKLDKIDAEKEFNKALAEFQDECPPIKKASTASIATGGGAKFSYKYAELDEIARTVKPHLFHRGLSFSWDSETVDGTVKTTCTLRHKNGHSISARFEAPVPETLGSMSEVQRHAAVLTYVKRQALVEVLGLTTTENDTDGISPEKVDDKQLRILRKMISDTGANEAKLCAFMQVEKIEDIRKVDFATAVMGLKAKEKSGGQHEDN